MLSKVIASFTTCILLTKMITPLLLGQENQLLHALAQHRDMQTVQSIHLQWQLTGPVVNGARAEAVQLDPSRPGTIYVAFGSGGLWKSTNNGIHWTCISEEIPAPGIGDIALAASDPEIVYLGTGESLRKQRNFTMPGTGVYRSDDGGVTWQHKGLQNNRHTGELVVHPEDPDIVLVAAMGKFWSPDTNQGIYRTADGGSNWDKVLYVDEKTRANDIVFAPSDPNVVYASMWANDIDTTLFESIYGPTSSIYRSDDAGATWQEINTGLPTEPKKGRIGLAVSHQNPDKAYALIDNHNHKRAHATEIYRTVDGGKIWTKTHEDSLRFSSVIGWYFADIYLNPQDDDEVFALGVRLAHSLDGGQNFTFIGGDVHHLHPSPAQTLHLDHCELWIDPTNPNHLALGNDGGLYTTYDKGLTWIHHNNIPTGEYYTITVEQKEPYRIMAGSQDDATVIGHAEEWTPGTPDPWEYLWIDAWSGGDGCYSAFDPENPNLVYMSMQNGAIQRLDLTTQRAKGIRPRDSTIVQKYAFVTPYFISEHSGDLYHAGNYVFKSADSGDQWDLISPDLSLSASPAKRSEAAGAIAESPLHAGQLYVGTDHGACWRSDDDGTTWVEISNGLANGYIRSIVPSRHTDGVVYLTMTGLNYDDLACYVYRSQDDGKTWTPINQGLAALPANVILEDAQYPEMLYLGTMAGVYISFDTGQTWEPLGSKMPLTSVADLKMIRNQSKLIVATHGRGIYQTDISPLYELQEIDTSQLSLFTIETVDAPMLRSTHKDIDQVSLKKADILYWSPTNAPTLLEVKDEKQKLLYSRDLSSDQGLNHFRWDLVYQEEESDLPYFLHDKRYLKAGEYEVSLTQQGEQAERILIVKTR